MAKVLFLRPNHRTASPFFEGTAPLLMFYSYATASFICHYRTLAHRLPGRSRATLCSASRLPALPARYGRATSLQGRGQCGALVHHHLRPSQLHFCCACTGFHHLSSHRADSLRCSHQHRWFHRRHSTIARHRWSAISARLRSCVPLLLRKHTHCAQFAVGQCG